VHTLSHSRLDGLCRMAHPLALLILSVLAALRGSGEFARVVARAPECVAAFRA